ncbi:MAG: membrane-associated PAP2 superfamily phosphatase [Paraglaciecola sp.]
MGGDQACVYLYDVFSAKLDIGHCFPSGHASGGFAMFSLYFAARILFPKYHVGHKVNLWFLPGLYLGLVFRPGVWLSATIAWRAFYIP